MKHTHEIKNERHLLLASPKKHNTTLGYVTWGKRIWLHAISIYMIEKHTQCLRINCSPKLSKSMNIKGAFQFYL